MGMKYSMSPVSVIIVNHNADTLQTVCVNATLEQTPQVISSTMHNA
jgi:GT2 family glycosyltransferase